MKQTRITLKTLLERGINNIDISRDDTGKLVVRDPMTGQQLADDASQWGRDEWLKLGKEHSINHTKLLGMGRAGNDLELPFRKFLDNTHVLGGEKRKPARTNISGGQELEPGHIGAREGVVRVSAGNLKQMIREMLSLAEGSWIAKPPAKFKDVIGQAEVDAPNTRQAADKQAQRWFDEYGVRIDPMMIDLEDDDEAPTITIVSRGEGDLFIIDFPKHISADGYDRLVLDEPDDVIHALQDVDDDRYSGPAKITQVQIDDDLGLGLSPGVHSLDDFIKQLSDIIGMYSTGMP